MDDRRFPQVAKALADPRRCESLQKIATADTEVMNRDITELQNRLQLPKATPRKRSHFLVKYIDNCTYVSISKGGN
jgi:hypothetical protein